MKQGVFKVYPVSSPQATFLNSFYFNSSSWWLVESGLKTQFSSSQIWSYFVTTVTCYWPWWLINCRSCSGLGTAIKKPTGRRGYSLGKPGQRGRHIATTCRHCYWATSSTRASVLCCTFGAYFQATSSTRALLSSNTQSIWATIMWVLKYTLLL